MYKIKIIESDNIVTNNGFTEEELERLEKSLTLLVDSYDELLEELVVVQTSDITDEEYEETKEVFYDTCKDKHICNNLLSIIRKNLE